MSLKTDISGEIFFKLRYNVHNDGSGFFWRVFITKKGAEEIMYYVNTIQCLVPTFSYSEMIGGIGHFSMAGRCSSFTIDNNYNAILK